MATDKKRVEYWIDDVDVPPVLRRVNPDGTVDIACNSPDNWSKSILTGEEYKTLNDKRQITKREASALFPALFKKPSTTP